MFIPIFHLGPRGDSQKYILSNHTGRPAASWPACLQLPWAPSLPSGTPEAFSLSSTIKPSHSSVCLWLPDLQSQGRALLSHLWASFCQSWTKAHLSNLPNLDQKPKLSWLLTFSLLRPRWTECRRVHVTLILPLPKSGGHNVDCSDSLLLLLCQLSL